MRVLACVLLAAGLVAAQETNAEGNSVFKSKMATRTLAADVLRDTPDFCFGSTTYQFYKPDQTWDLEVFCGKATCMKNTTGMYEIVNDCGVAPKPNENCRPLIPEGRSAFPDCCPQFECLPGATLEYPTDAEIKEQLELARQQQRELEAQLQQEIEAAEAAAAADENAAAAAEEPAAADAAAPAAAEA